MLKEFMCENSMLHVHYMSFSLPISCIHYTSIQTHRFKGMHVSGELQVEISTPAFYFNNCTFKWTWHLFEWDLPICERTLLSALGFFVVVFMFLLLLIFKWKVVRNVRLLWTTLHAEKRKFKDKPRQAQLNLVVLYAFPRWYFSSMLVKCSDSESQSSKPMSRPGVGLSSL